MWTKGEGAKDKQSFVEVFWKYFFRLKIFVSEPWMTPRWLLDDFLVTPDWPPSDSLVTPSRPLGDPLMTPWSLRGSPGYIFDQFSEQLLSFARLLYFLIMK